VCATLSPFARAFVEAQGQDVDASNESDVVEGVRPADAPFQTEDGPAGVE
jgi:hypothetical protein